MYENEWSTTSVSPPAPELTENPEKVPESAPPTPLSGVLGVSGEERTSRKQQIESQIGEKITGMSPEWARTLMRQGVIIKLQVHRWRPYTRIDAEDLGIPSDDPAYRAFIDQYVTLGRKKLLPPDIIHAIERCESAARDTLRRYSYDTLWGRFVPVTAYRRLKGELEALRATYLDLGADLVANLANYRDEMRRTYRVAGFKAWTQIHGGPVTDGDNAEAERFVSDFCDRVLARIPDPETIRRSFLFEFTPYHVPLPSEFEQDLLAEVQTRDARDMEAQRRRLMVDMNREVAEHYRSKKQEMVDGFLKAVVGQMSSLVHEVAVNVQESIERNDGRLVGRSAMQLKNLIERVEVLNFYEDARIEHEIGSIKTQLDRAADDRDIVEIGETLRRIRDIAAQDLIALNEPTRTRRDTPDADMVRAEPLRRDARPELSAEEVPAVREVRRPRRRAIEQEVAAVVAA